MTFLAVRRWLGWSAGKLLVLDIGGGFPSSYPAMSPQSLDNYFNEIKSNTLSFEVFTVLSTILYLAGFLKLWCASKIIRK